MLLRVKIYGELVEKGGIKRSEEVCFGTLSNLMKYILSAFRGYNCYSSRLMELLYVSSYLSSLPTTAEPRTRGRPRSFFLRSERSTSMAPLEHMVATILYSSMRNYTFYIQYGSL